VRGGPRARRTSPEGAFSPRARRTSPEGGAHSSSEADLVRGGVKPCRSGGPRGPSGSCSCHVCVLASWISLHFAFFTKLGGFSPVV
jgi:hypothetical protein